MMESKEIPVVLCFNKEDIATDPQIKELEEIYETCGYPMVFVSAKEERGIEKIRELLKGKTTAIAGPSGGRKIFDHQYSAAGRRDGDRCDQHKD